MAVPFFFLMVIDDCPYKFKSKHILSSTLIWFLGVMQYKCTHYFNPLAHMGPTPMKFATPNGIFLER